MTTSLTMGVVGHVDHGKTALVRALTGTETDRLKEERDRGLSIVLGFAFLETEHGAVDLIDVPGHEDFVRAMIAGATALDGIVLCIAANEGPMPQTVEHLNIARLLGVDKGFVVVTKADLLSTSELAAVEAEIRTLVRDTFLDGAPLLSASSVSGAGIDAVRQTLSALAARPVERELRGRIFLPLDRVFTLRGFGLVATGTLRGGPLRVGDAVEIMPARRPTTVRALQIHHQPVEQAAPGQRVAVNLRHIDRTEVDRGDVLAAPGSISPTRRIDVELRLVDNVPRPVKNGAVLRFLTGTSEASAKLRLLDRRELAAGDASLAQLTLDRDLATLRGERFLLRSYSPMYTVGGGRILDVNAEHHHRFDAAAQQRLETAASGDAERILEERLAAAGTQGVLLAALAETCGLERMALDQAGGRLGAVIAAEGVAVAASAYAALLTEVMAVLERFHADQPFKKGLDIGSLTSALESQPSPEVLHHALHRLVEENKIHAAHDFFGIAGHDPFARLGERERRLLADIERAFLAAGYEPPSPASVVGADQTKQSVYRLLLETGRLIRLRTYDRSAQIVLHVSVLEDVKQTIARRFPYPQPFALKDIRDLLNSTRKFVVPLMEHLDATGATVRSGDLRRLRQQ